MSSQAIATDPAETTDQERIPIIDVDVHNYLSPTDPGLAAYMSERWRTYIQTWGLRTQPRVEGVIRIKGMRPKPGAPSVTSVRQDSFPPGGGLPCSDPAFAREQHLDHYGIDAAVLHPVNSHRSSGFMPAQLMVDFARANNDYNRDLWFEADPRWYSGIVIPVEQPEEAAKEIRRCAEASNRFVQVDIGIHTEKPIGNPFYWAIFEAAAHYRLPIAFHYGGSAFTPVTACGAPSYFLEDHCGFALSNFPTVASMIFEGIFDRWPDLRIVLAELGWTWVAPFAWRLDGSWRILRDEVPHLQRKPSDYLQHFWWTTQPAEEPEQPEWLEDALAQFNSLGLESHLMFNSDYPHWDFDPPEIGVPQWLGRDVRRRLLCENASALFGIPVQRSGA